MKERIKQLRKELCLTQLEFAVRIGISRGNIATYETRDGSPGNSVVALICREFDVNVQWLRTGKGEMFIQKSRDEEVAAFVGDILSEKPDFRLRLISALARLSPEKWKLLEELATDMMNEIKEADP